MNKTRDCRYSRLSDDDKTNFEVAATLLNEAFEFLHEVDFSPTYGVPICNAMLKLYTLLDESITHIEKTILPLLSSGTTEVPEDEKYIVMTGTHGNVEWTRDGFICPRCRYSNGFDYISQNPYCKKCGLKMEPNWGGKEDEA